jgi:hypothetical protein
MIPQKRVSLAHPNSLPQPTSFLTAIPILYLPSPQPMQPKELGPPFTTHSPLGLPTSLQGSNTRLDRNLYCWGLQGC